MLFNLKTDTKMNAQDTELQRLLNEMPELQVLEDDLLFIVDQLTNSMEFYSNEEFVSHMVTETNLTENAARMMFVKYWDLSPDERMMHYDQWLVFVANCL